MDQKFFGVGGRRKKKGDKPRSFYCTLEFRKRVGSLRLFSESPFPKKGERRGGGGISNQMIFSIIFETWRKAWCNSSNSKKKRTLLGGLTAERPMWE